MRANVLNMTNRELRAMRNEINRQTAHNVRKLCKNIQALMLWELREQEGWGRTKILRFQKRFVPSIRMLEEYYLSESADETDFICAYKLKHELGIDLMDLDDIIDLKIKIND